MDMFKALMEYDTITTKLRKEITDKANNNIKIEKEDKDILFQALVLKLPLSIIATLVQNGADITVKRQSYYKDDYMTEYPLTIAIGENMDIEYVKLLDNTLTSPIYKIGILNKFRPNNDIIEYLLSQIDNYLEHTDDNSYLKQWHDNKWTCEFWKNGRLIEYDIITPMWHFSPLKQQVSRAIRYSK